MQLKLKELRTEYEKAKKDGVKTFVLNECIFVTDYAKYLIEFCEQKKIAEDEMITLTETEGEKK